MTINLAHVMSTLIDIVDQSCDDDDDARMMINEIDCEYYDDENDEIDHNAIKSTRANMRKLCVAMINEIDTRAINDDDDIDALEIARECAKQQKIDAS